MLEKLKNIFSIALTCMVVATLLGSCTDEIDSPAATDGGPVLRLSVGNSLSRADNDNCFPDDENVEHNEDAIRRVVLFFFEKENTDKPAFFIHEVNVNKVSTADLTIRIPASCLDNFTAGATPTQKEGYVYALVNLPDNVTVDPDLLTIQGESATIENIMHTWVSEPAFINRQLPPTGFVMRGGNKVTVVESNGWQATGNVPLERLAAKVRLFAELPEVIYMDSNGNTMEKEPGESESDWQERVNRDAKEQWVPAPGDSEEGNMKLYFYCAATNGRIDAFVDVENRGKMGFKDVDRTASESIVRTIYKDPEVNDADKDPKYNYTHTTPYYSYPNRWNSLSPTEEYMTYVIIELPWRMTKNANGDATSEFRKCYYQVPVNAIKAGNIEADRLDPNKYYRIKIRLGALGSRDFGTPLQVKASYEVIDWVQTNVDVNIKGKRYLVVNQHEWTVNNENYLEIPFSTSHPTKVEECYVTYFRYNDVWGNDPDGKDPSNPNNRHDKNEFDNWLTFADNQLKNGRHGEGPVEMESVTDGKNGDILYYKKEYFYDKYYEELESQRRLDYKGGFHYYVGHEHPVTFHPDYVNINNAKAKNDTKGWSDYVERYGINDVYTCTIDDERNVIMFDHPLVQWDAERDNTGKITHYKPTLNRQDRLWDEYSRVEITIKIRHTDWTTWKDDGLYVETIHITQYPGIYITVSHNYGQVVKDNYTDQNRYILVNNHPQGPDNDNMNGAMYEFNFVASNIKNNYESNTNPNMYLIHTTQLSEEYNNYVIGDPRMLYTDIYLSGLDNYDDQTSRTLQNANDKMLSPSGNSEAPTHWSGRDWGYTNWNGFNWVPTYKGYNIEIASVADLDGNERRLTYYYPTDESDVTENFIAPTFRIASSFGRTTVNGRVEMRRRCASYQEAGRPAGRWRVPTKAEVSYIAQLSADGKIPILFGSTVNADAWGYYWSAQGGVKANGKGQVENSTGDPGNNYPEGVAATRCVYDEWYWTKVDGGEFPEAIRPNGPLEHTFYWGDKPKDNTQN